MVVLRLEVAERSGPRVPISRFQTPSRLASGVPAPRGSRCASRCVAARAGTGFVPKPQLPPAVRPGGRYHQAYGSEATASSDLAQCTSDCWAVSARSADQPVGRCRSPRRSSSAARRARWLPRRSSICRSSRGRPALRASCSSVAYRQDPRPASAPRPFEPHPYPARAGPDPRRIPAVRCARWRAARRFPVLPEWRWFPCCRRCSFGLSLMGMGDYSKRS